MIELRVFVVLFALCRTSANIAQVAPLVETCDGKIQGQISRSYNGGDFMEFVGIPFSEPRIGRRRFDPPEPISKWYGILAANLTSTCLQVTHSAEIEDGKAQGIEDCLHLNIFVPGSQINPEKSYDVILMIHGGGFNFGKQQPLKPNFFMDREVILATFNYRVGIAGFLSTGDQHLPGNNGLKDQVLAMKWIKNNIAFFGGNPASITLAGISAGGASTHYHYISPQSKGLFNRGISSSGSVLNSWVLQEEPLRRARIVGRAVGCNREDTGDLVECLKSKTGTQLNDAIKKLRSWLMNPFSPLAPVVDKYSQEPFIPEHPYSLLAKGRVNDAPWIFTTVTSEGLYPAARFVRYLAQLNERWEEILPGLLHYEDTIGDKLKITKKIKERYFKDKAINNETFFNLVQMLSDRNFVADIGVAAKLQANVSAYPVRFYMYDYLSVQKRAKFGVSHGDDMLIFNNPSELDPEDVKIKDFLLDVWTSYAKYGNPGVEIWDAVNKSPEGPVNYLYIGRKRELEMRYAADIGNGIFWHNLPFAENANLFKSNKLLSQIPVSFALSAPIVTTSDGKIQGQIAKSYNGGDYIEFKGIPYSEPRIGRKRFDPPEPINKWYGIRVANLTSICLQVIHSEPKDGRALGVEDCLHLNIFVPGNRINPNKSYDVIIMIHGGAFNFGNQAFQKPNFLMDRDIILATFNYRLGVTGFLSTGDHHLPGNNGLKDQVLAMKWIKSNIAFFGGNPASITLAGLSAGGASAHFHYISPQSKGLFNRGISVSGVALNSWALQEEPLRRARIIGEAVGCNHEDTGDLVECLKTKTGSQLNEAVKKLRIWLFNPFSPLAPVIDKYSHEPFIPEHPYSLIAKGLVNDVPWIFTIVTSEGLYPAAFFARYLSQLNERWEEILPGLLHYEDTIGVKLKPEITKRIKRRYFKDRAINNKTFHNLVQMLSDRNFVADIGVASKLQANVSAYPVRFYMYDYLAVKKRAKFGVNHGDDLLIYERPTELDPEDAKMKDFLLDVWTSFAKYGNPGVNIWDAVNKNLEGPLNYLYIGRKRELEMRSAADIGNGTFWLNLPFLENAKITKETT